MPDEKDQKDRLGDTLHKKERGEEEKYFAEQDRLRLARLRERAGGEPRAPRASCPRCGRPLLPTGQVRGRDECDGACAAA